MAEGYDSDPQLTHITLHDQLTELPNRHLFMEYLEKAMAKQRDDHHIAVLLINLNKFRIINASLGHDMGDWLLMEIAQRLQACLDKKTILARANGDDFMILLDNMPDFIQATNLAVTINEVFAQPFSLLKYNIVISACISIAYYIDQEDATELLRDTDAAMYRAKTLGKPAYVVFHRDMRNDVVSRLQMETDLIQAVDTQNFVMFYQPLIELSSKRVVGMESLIRFRHPQNGLISPDEFIHVLEDTGIIIAIGSWVLQTACSQLRAWWNAGLIINRITVNLSSHQFRSKDLIKTIVESLESSNLEPECLELEVTESLLLEDAESAIKILKFLKNMGFSVIIDDFGTGYASLNYLKRFPADGLKIDRAFIKGIISSPEDTAITVAMIDMAHALGLRVTAKGVETFEQEDFLRDQSCDFVQGYLYTVPIDEAASIEWCKQYCDNINPKSAFRRDY